LGVSSSGLRSRGRAETEPSDGQLNAPAPTLPPLGSVSSARKPEKEGRTVMLEFWRALLRMNRSVSVPRSVGAGTRCSHPGEIAEVGCLDQGHPHSTGRTTPELSHPQLPGSETSQAQFGFLPWKPKGIILTARDTGHICVLRNIFKINA